MGLGCTGRLERLAAAYPLRVRGVSLSLLALRSVQRSLEVRAMGLAAEMTYYAVLSAFPLVGAIGASLGFLERLVGPEQAWKAGQAIVRGLRAVFSAEVTADVVEPLVQGLLSHERAGLTLGGFVVTLFLASRIFRSAIEAVDAAYRAQGRRGTVSLWAMGMLFALGSVVVVTTILGMVVVGPLLGGGKAIAHWLGYGVAFEVVWAVARWPVVFAIATVYLSLLYRSGPGRPRPWSESLPGAVGAMSALVLVAVGFRVYIELTGLQRPSVGTEDEAVAAALGVIGALMAMLLWGWLSSIALIAGGIINAELGALRQRRATDVSDPRGGAAGSGSPNSGSEGGAAPP